MRQNVGPTPVPRALLSVFFFFTDMAHLYTTLHKIGMRMTFF
jgi:hypothetical protein